MNELALFAGVGGGILGGKLLGWRTVCAVERDAYAAQVLVARQNDRTFNPFPVWSDVTTFDGTKWRGLVDVVSGGFPCQDISSAGKGVGISGERSGLWNHMLRIIDEVQPKYAFIENSPHLRTKGLVTVLQGLAEIGYDAAWGVLSASDCGANHERKRMWIVATNTNLHSEPISAINGEAQRLRSTTEDAFTDTDLPQCQGRWLSCGRQSEHSNLGLEAWWTTAPELHRMDDGVAFGSHRLKAIGNGQVPIVAATAFVQLARKLDRSKYETSP